MPRISVDEDGNTLVLPDGFALVPEESGWFGYGSALESVERHGLTFDEYHEMLNAQHGNCAMCGRHQTSVGALVIDHDHLSGEVRRLLCQKCNRGLGQFDDSPQLLEAAARYLWQNGCWLTRPETPEEKAELDRHRMAPEEYERQRRERAEHGWLDALRHVWDCQRGAKPQPLDEAWAYF